MKVNQLKLIKVTFLLLAIFPFPLNAGVVGDMFKKPKETIGYSANEDKGLKRRRAVDLRDVQDAFNNSSPEDNITRFSWKASEVFKVKLRLRMKTLIRLPDDEEIKAYTIGDNKSFKVTPIGEGFKNMLDIQSFYAGVDTNLTIIGKRGRIYNFYLRSYPVKSKYTPDFTIYVDAPPLDPDKSVQFMASRNIDGKKLSKREKLIQEITDNNDYLKSLPDTEVIYLDYKMYGEKDIAPYSVYDDGKWTYFDFRGQGIVESGRLPVIYKVVDGFDSIVNTRYKDGIMVAESLNFGWTIKSGNETVCVRGKSKKKFNKRFDIRS